MTVGTSGCRGTAQLLGEVVEHFPPGITFFAVFTQELVATLHLSVIFGAAGQSLLLLCLGCWWFQVEFWLMECQAVRSITVLTVLSSFQAYFGSRGENIHFQCWWMSNALFISTEVWQNGVS